MKKIKKNWVLIIKNKKMFLLGAFLGIIIIIIIPISNVVASPPPASEKPTFFSTLHGIHVSGDIDDLQHFYDNAVYWKGDLYFYPDFPFFLWCIEPALCYDDPGYTYKHVFLEVRFKYSGSSDLRIIIFYAEGGCDEFPEPSTGGNYVMKYYTLDSYKTVSYISFYNAAAWYGGQQDLYIDCASVGYSAV